MSVRVALVGCGVWGQNLLRALSQSPRAEVVAVADPSAARLARARAVTPRARLVRSLEEALEARVSAVVIATPAHTHAPLAIAALDAGADVFVEKPLAQTPQEASLCAAKAAAAGRVGMVGHLLRYHPSVVRLIELTREARFGPLRRFTAARLRSASDRSSSILWSLGPHDLSVLRALDPSPITSIDAEWRDDGDRVIIELVLESGVTARIELARSNPTKERRFAVLGGDLTARFDDVRAPDRIALEASVAGVSDAPACAPEVQVDWREPLSIEIDHFLDCVERRAAPLTPFEEGACVVRSLSRIEAALPRRASLPGVEIAAGEPLRGTGLGG